MNKRKIVSWMLILILLICTGCAGENSSATDAVKFKEEYESLNGKKTESGQTYMDVTIARDNPMVYADIDDLEQLLTDGTGIIYFGFPECPWCRSVLEVFLDVAKEQGIQKVLYYDHHDERNTIVKKDDGSLEETKAGSKNYQKLLEMMGDWTSVYGGLDDPTLRRIYYPTYVFVRGGTIVGTHVSSLDGISDPYIPLTTEQKEQLAGIYRELIGRMESCDLNQGC